MMEKRLTPRQKNKLKQYLFVASIMVYPLLLFVVFWLGVNLNSIIMAFEKRFMDAPTQFAGVENFVSFVSQVVSNAEILSIGFRNSLTLYLCNLLILTPLSVFFSYCLYKKCKGHSIIRFTVMLPQLMGGFVVVLVFQRFVEGALPAIFTMITGQSSMDFPKLLSNPNYTFGTVTFFNIWIGFCTMLIMIPNAMKEVDSEIIESAQIDGVDNMIQEMGYILLPMIYPTLSTFLITQFAGIFGNTGALMEFYRYDAYPETYTIGYWFTVKMAVGSTVYDYPVAAAGGVLLTVLLAPLTFLLRFILDKVDPGKDE